MRLQGVKAGHVLLALVTVDVGSPVAMPRFTHHVLVQGIVVGKERVTIEAPGLGARCMLCRGLLPDLRHLVSKPRNVELAEQLDHECEGVDTVHVINVE
jgi:hypothetical protein